jgi:hypothetical protein
MWRFLQVFGRQILWMVLQLSVNFGLHYEIHYKVVWVYTETTNLLWPLTVDCAIQSGRSEKPSNKCIRHEWRSVHNHEQLFRMKRSSISMLDIEAVGQSYIP